MTPQPQLLPAPVGASGEALDLVFIEGFTAPTLIGIHANELHEKQPVVIDLQAGLPPARPRHAGETDRIRDTIDYSRVRERLLRLLAEHRVQLLEALAEQIAGVLLHEFGALWVRIKVAKPRKFDDVAAVGVVIERWAAIASTLHDSAHHARSAAVLTLIGSGMVPARN
jgi:7,8-dihydroneopterin aldolase/epimerase/oxygenase